MRRGGRTVVKGRSGDKRTMRTTDERGTKDRRTGEKRRREKEEMSREEKQKR